MPGDIGAAADALDAAAMAVPGGIGLPGPEVVMVAAEGGGGGGTGDRGISEPYGARLDGAIGGAATMAADWGTSVCGALADGAGETGADSSAEGAAEAGGGMAEPAGSVIAGGGAWLMNGCEGAMGPPDVRPWLKPRERSAAGLAGGVEDIPDAAEVGGSEVEGSEGEPEDKPLAGLAEAEVPNGLDVVGMLGEAPLTGSGGVRGTGS